MSMMTTTEVPVVRPDIKSAQIWQQFDAFVETYTVPWERRARTILAAEGIRAAARFEEYGEAAAMVAVDDDEWFVYLNRLWLAVVPEAGILADSFINALKAKPAIYEPLVTAT